MLQLVDIRKAYTMAAFTQVALDDVSLSFRDSEFAAILGPSGSGKTTLLNILGGLDHADAGDIVINGVSTKDYSDKDWDAYRNHRIGFIFQSYNLIPHQSVLSNVELALTLAGDSSARRRERALAALARVGLAEHADKRPNQLSGGQMQRVAIARALVNDPDIVLADEPTGALDTDTGIQVMELLAEIARDRLVVMVTHNPELAEQYATRIIRLKDGRIEGDTNPITAEEAATAGAVLPRDAREGRRHAAVPAGENVYGLGDEGTRGTAGGSHASAHRRSRAQVSDATRHASMSFLTALALSFNNLMTKKGRTFMTAFAGSIGIIGIAAILALSNGVNDYIARTEEEALSSYPLTITKSSFDLTNLMMASMSAGSGGKDATDTRVIDQSTIMSDMFAKVKNNDLRTFKAFLESGESGIEPYVNSIQYTYGINPIIYKGDTSAGVVKLNPSRMGSTLANGLAGSAFLGGQSMTSFTCLLDDQRLLDQSLELVEGRWPSAYDECVFVLGRNGGVTDYTLYSLGFYDIKVMDDMLTHALAGEEVTVPTTTATFTRDDALAMRFAVVAPPLLYQKHEGQNTWTDMTGDKTYMRRMLAQDAVDLHVVGIVKQTDGAGSSGIPEGIAYTPALTLHLMEESQHSQIVAEQQANPDVDVFTGKTFEELADDENRNLDMESVFSIDEDVLKAAFSFDASALSGLGQGMDLSGLDLGSAFASMDFSHMDLSSAFAGNDLGLSGLADAMPNADALKAELLAEMAKASAAPGGTTLDPSQLGTLVGAAGGLAQDFVGYLSSKGIVKTEDGLLVQPDVVGIMGEFVQRPETEAALDQMLDSLDQELTEDERTAAKELVRSYLADELAPYLQDELAKADLASMSEEELGQFLQGLLAGAPQMALDELGTAIGADALAGIAADTATSLAGDFASWLYQHPELLLGDYAKDKGPDAYAQLVQEYLASSSAQEILDEATSDMVGDTGSAMVDAISRVMADYMAKIPGQIEQAMSASMASMGETITKTLATELATQMAAASGQLGSALAGQMSAQMAQLSDAMQGAFSVDADAFAKAIQFNMTQEDLTSLLTNYMNADELTYEANLSKLGFAEQDNPESISIYPIDFPAKEEVLRIVDDYNERMEAAGNDDATIQYSDIAGVLMSSVTDIVNTISLVLIAFVSISLVVSSIMISIITYISVLERKKEIGILRAMGASKLNVANIFNAETVIEGFFAGVLAVTVVYAASVPVNALVYHLKDVPNIMQLKPENATALVAISVALTLVAGLIPSSAAARRDPVEALRSE